MNFELTANQLDAQKIARDFAENVLNRDILDRDASARFPRELYDEMGRMGLIGIPYPVEAGGPICPMSCPWRKFPKWTPPWESPTPCVPLCSAE